MSKLVQAAKDWWVAFTALISAAISAYNVVSQIQSKGDFQLTYGLAIELIFFVIFGSIAIVKEIKKARDTKELSSSKAVLPSPNNKSIVAGHDIIANQGGKVVGRDMYETHHHYPDSRNEEMDNNETYFVEIEVSGLVGNTSLTPKRKFVTVFFDGSKTRVKNILDNLPVM